MDINDVQKVAGKYGINLTQQDIRRILESAEGRQLLALLNQDGGASLRKAASAISSGNQAETKKALSAILSQPDAAELLRKLGGSHG